MSKLPFLKKGILLLSFILFFIFSDIFIIVQTFYINVTEIINN